MSALLGQSHVCFLSELNEIKDLLLNSESITSKQFSLSLRAKITQWKESEAHTSIHTLAFTLPLLPPEAMEGRLCTRIAIRQTMRYNIVSGNNHGEAPDQPVWERDRRWAESHRQVAAIPSTPPNTFTIKLSWKKKRAYNTQIQTQIQQLKTQEGIAFF